MMTEVKPVLEDVLTSMEVDSTLKTRVIHIDSKEQCDLLLRHFNTGNRPVKKPTYVNYAYEFLRGKWRQNGETFIFGVDGKGNESIISAQHRLFGLSAAFDLYNKDPDNYPDADLTLEVVCVYNVPVEVADTVDNGMIRSHSDVLYRDSWIEKAIPKEWSNTTSRKVKWCKTLAVAARLVWLRAGGATVSSAPKFIVSEMLEFIKDDHKELCEFVSSVLSSSEEEGAGLKISIPYIAALCYVASMDEEGNIIKKTKDLLLDQMLTLAQNQVTAGTATHALGSYWNKMFSTPGGKDRDLDIVGPYVKALNAIIEGEKITAAKIALSTKERENYKTHPPLLKGWDEACFIYAAETKSELLDAAERAKEAKIEEREKKAQEKAAEAAAKEVEKQAAMVEKERLTSKVPVKSNAMQALGKMVKKAGDKPPTTEGVSSKPMIKRRPVPAKK